MSDSSSESDVGLYFYFGVHLKYYARIIVKDDNIKLQGPLNLSGYDKFRKKWERIQTDFCQDIASGAAVICELTDDSETGRVSSDKLRVTHSNYHEKRDPMWNQVSINMGKAVKDTTLKRTISKISDAMLYGVTSEEIISEMKKLKTESEKK